MLSTRLTRFAAGAAAIALVFVIAVPHVSAQSVSLATGSPTFPPPPPPGPCLGNFSPDGDIFDPLALGPVTIPMGPPGCGLGWPGPPPPMAANVDAFSSGLAPVPPGLPLPVAVASLLFSVDGVATGSGGAFACSPLTPVFPGTGADVNSEAGLLPFSSDAAADWFLASTNVVAPLPGVEPMPHLGFADGDGFLAPPFLLPHPLGAPFALAEPVPGGDDVDALDFAPIGAYDFLGPDGVPDIPVYYSVDFATAAAGGFLPADVFLSVGGATMLYAPPAALGLDVVGGPGSDDIDALVVVDVLMDGFYDPTLLFGPDIIYYSLAPGSASIGALDACLGLPVEEGDILADATTLGLPGALCTVLPAENAGLWASRFCGLNPVTGLGGDNVNAIDFHPPIILTTSTTTTSSTTTSTTSSTTTTATVSTTTTSSTTTTTTLAPLCGASPELDASCRLADSPGGDGKSSLIMKNKADDTKDQLKWKWKKGVATDAADFLSPDTGTATMRLCVYDSGGKLAELDLPAGGTVPTCGTKPCWKVNGSGTTFKYKNKAGGPSGITGAKLKAGAAGKAQVQFKVQGKGGFYTSPATDTLVTDVVVQFLIDDGFTTECFKTAFPGSSGLGVVKKQDAENFKAKGP